MDTTTRQEINKKLKDNNIINQLDLTHIYKIFPTRAEYSTFSNAHGASFRKAHMPGHKTNFSKF